MPRDLIPADRREDLARQFDQAAAMLRAPDRMEKLTLWDVKFFLLALLNDTDRQLDYGNPGAGIDHLLQSATAH